MLSLLDRLEKSITNLEAGTNVDEDNPVAVSEYDDLFSADIDPFIKVCKKLGLSDIAILTEDAYVYLRVVILTASKCKKPKDEVFQKFCQPLFDVVNSANAQVDNRSPNFNHQKAFAEAIPMLSWIFQAKPAAVIPEFLNSADFYLNKVLTTNKDATNKEDHRNFVKFLKNIFNDMTDYVKQNHNIGLAWNVKGGIDFDKRETDKTDNKPSLPSSSETISKPKQEFKDYHIPPVIEARFQTLLTRLEQAISNKPSQQAEDDEPYVLTDYDALYKKSIQPFIDSCKVLNLDEMGNLVETAFKFLRDIIVKTTKCKKPKDEVFQKFCQPLFDVVNSANAQVDNRSPNFNHQKAFAEAIPMLSWIFQAKPAAVIPEFLNSADFYLNKVLTTNKDATNKEDHRNFVKFLKNIFNDMTDYVKQNHNIGLAWNVKGIDFA